MMQSIPQRRETLTLCSCCDAKGMQTKVNGHVVQRQRLDPPALEKTVPGYRLPDNDS